MFLKTFSTTKQKQRAALADQINAFVWNHATTTFDLRAKQSSDEEFHCLTITLAGRKYSAEPTSGDRAGGSIRYRRPGDATWSYFRSVRIVSATMYEERERLGESLGEMPDECEVIVLQSSDSQFHCLTYLVLVP